MNLYKPLGSLKNSVRILLLLFPLISQAQWLVNQGYYGGNQTVTFSGEGFTVWSASDSTLGFKANTFRKDPLYSDIYASYGRIGKLNGARLSSVEVPPLNQVSNGIYTSDISMISYDLGVAITYESQIDRFGNIMDAYIAGIDVHQNSILWKQKSREFTFISSIFVRQQDSVVWFQVGQPYDTSSYFIAINVNSGDSLMSFPSSRVFPNHLDSLFNEYRITRSTLFRDTFFIEFVSENVNTRATLGYTTARKWVKAYDPNGLEIGAIDSVYYSDYNLDKDLLTPAGDGEGIYFYEFSDSIVSATADSGIKNFTIYNWKKEWVVDMAVKLKVTRRANNNPPPYLEAGPFFQNGFTLIYSDHFYGPTDLEYYGSRLTLFDSTGALMYDIISDTTKPSWIMSYFYIDKTGDVYYQGVDPNNYNFKPLGRILPNGQNYRTLPLSVKGNQPNLFNFEVYPIPVVETLHVDIGVQECVGYQLYDLNGLTLMEGEVRSKGEIDVSSLIRGLYVLKVWRVKAPELGFVEKVMVE